MEHVNRKRLDPKDYTVVWIAPLLIEAKACFGVLDKRHEGYFEIQDNQDYNFSGGSLNGHNIIVATFPKGENYGIASAAALFNQVKIIFPTKFVLLVGVAAGVPKLGSEDPKADRDIRLGDVLVAVPDKKSTGVVAYDSGTLTNDGFTITSRQSETLRLFRSTYTHVELQDSDPFAEGHDFAIYLRAMQDKVRIMYPRDNFERPSWAEDVFYSYVHDKDSEGTPVNRGPRTIPERPQIWFGNIGSGNTLMRNHKRRDLLRDEFDLIGLEMEAAGVINFSQAAVIRGACDYGDRKKNKDWQGYAAAVAAVYAKGVLMSITPTKIETKQQGHGSRGYPETQAAPGQGHRKEFTENSKREDEFSDVTIDSEEGRNILQWLSKRNYVDKYQRCLTAHQPGTANWVFEAAPYHAWKRGDASNLLCKGHPGTGKSIITALIAQRAQQEGHVVCVVFFNRDEDRHSDELKFLAAMTRQLVKQSKRISNVIFNIFKSYQEDKSQRITKRDLLTMLESEIRRSDRVCFAIDALDECAKQARLDLLLQLSLLQKSYPHIMIAMSTRRIHDIIATVTDTFPKTETLNVSADDTDLKSYIEERFRIRALLQPARRHKGLYEKLERRLMDKVDGMFLLIILRCQLLEAQRPKTERDFIDSTTKICQAQTLRDTYIEMWRHILNQDYDQAEIAKRVFTWVCFSVDPLHIEQLRHALAAQMSPRPTSISHDTLLHQDLITESCIGLLVITGNNVVAFMHVTAGEIFPEIIRREIQNPQTQICQACLRYLSQTNLGPCVTSEQIAHQLNDFPFLSYAAKSWSHHATIAENHFRCRGLLRWLSQSHSVGRAVRIAAFLDPTHVLVLPQLRFPADASAQHLLALFGMTDVLRHILRWGLSPRPWETDEWKALIQTFAVLFAVDILIAASLRTAEYSLITNNAWTLTIGVLAAACIYILADRSMRQSVDSDVRDSNGWTPLRYAAWREHSDVMELLYTVGTDSDAKDVEGNTTLMWALGERTTSYRLHPSRTVSSSGDVQMHIGNTYKLPACAEYPEWIMPSPPRCSDEVTKRLIYDSKKIDSKNESGRTPLIQAAVNRQFRHVQMILDHGADVELTDDTGLTALLGAVQCRPESYEVPSMELSGTDSMHIGDYIVFDAEHSQTAEDLQRDTVGSIIGRLIGQRTVDARDEWGRTALAYAMANGQRQLVVDLLSVGADMSCRDYANQTPLTWATTRSVGQRIIIGELTLSGHSKLSQGLFLELRGGYHAEECLLGALIRSSFDLPHSWGGLDKKPGNQTSKRGLDEPSFSVDDIGVNEYAEATARLLFPGLDELSTESPSPQLPVINNADPTDNAAFDLDRQVHFYNDHKTGVSHDDLRYGMADYSSPFNKASYDPVDKVGYFQTDRTIRHVYGEMHWSGSGGMQIDGDLDLRTNGSSDTLSRLESALHLSSMCFATLVASGGIYVQDHASVVRGNLVGDETCPLDSMWTKGMLGEQFGDIRDST